MDDADRRSREGQAGVEGGDGRVVPAGDPAEEDRREDRAGQVQPGACRQGQVVDNALAAQRDGYLGDGTAGGGGLLLSGHRHVGGAEIDMSGAERGDARATAHRGVADGYTGMLLVIPAEGRSEERRVERRPGPGQRGFLGTGSGPDGGHCLARGARGAGGCRAGAGTGSEQDDRHDDPGGGVGCAAGPGAGPCVLP
jgi:hypothetical protein